MTDNKQWNVSNCLISLQHPLFAQHCTAQYLGALPKTWRRSLSDIKPGNSNKLCWLLIFPLVHSAHFSDYQSLIWRWCILHARWRWKHVHLIESVWQMWCREIMNTQLTDACAMYIHILGSRDTDFLRRKTERAAHWSWAQSCCRSVSFKRRK